MKTCATKGCNKLTNGRALCSMHAARKYRNGTAGEAEQRLTRRPKGMNAKQTCEWLFANCVSIDENDCWNCTLAKRRHGYVAMYFNGRKLSAHRFVYETMVSPIKNRHVIKHECDNPSCINPSHLTTGTQQENMQDASSRRRLMHGESHCDAVLNEELVQKIRSLSNQGLSQRKIADRLGIKRSTARGVIDGTTWKHVTTPESIAAGIGPDCAGRE